MNRMRGQALVEFALVFPILFFLLAITIDLYRVDWATSTVAEAARQGARQAVPNEDPSDNPFGPSAGPCSGTTQTPSAGGSGCLTDSRIRDGRFGPRRFQPRLDADRGRTRRVPQPRGWVGLSLRVAARTGSRRRLCEL
jgi:hypothetical protein